MQADENPGLDGSIGVAGFDAALGISSDSVRNVDLARPLFERMFASWALVSSLLGGVIPSDAERRGRPARRIHAPLDATPLEFEEVYADNFSFIWRAVRGLGVPHAQADDVTQEVFVIAYRKLETLERPTSLRAWLFGIARRVAKDYRRAQNRRGVPVEFEEERSQSVFPDPEVCHARRQDMELVRGYVERLDEERRALFFLALVEGLPVSEVAETLGVNSNTTYSRVRTLRRELSLHLASNGGGPDGPD